MNLLKWTSRTLAMTSLAVLCGLQVSNAALPPFAFPDLDGKNHSQVEFEGKYVLLDVWATWCTTCRNVVENVKALRKLPEAKDLAVVGISIDKGSPDKVKTFAKKMSIDWLLLLDPKNTMAPVLKYENVPAVFFYSPKGELLGSMVGYDPAKEAELMALVKKTLSGK